MDTKFDWSYVPEHILVHIFSFIPQSLRYHISLVCCSWNNAFRCPYLWRSFTFTFKKISDKKILVCLDTFGEYLQDVTIEVDQFEEYNRTHAISLIEKLSELRHRIRSFELRFIGNNPMLFSGGDFLITIKKFFESYGSRSYQQLKTIDMKDLKISFDDELLGILIENNPNIENVNLHFRVIVSKITKDAVLKLVTKCRKLKKLSVYNETLTEEVLMCFLEEDRVPLEVLSIAVRREQKYINEMTSNIWTLLRQKLPNLVVTLYFDHTCPLHKVSEILKYDIPVTILKLETYTYIYNEVRLAANQYKDTLEEVILRAPLSRKSPELNTSLIELATECTHLKSLMVYCDLDEETADKILEIRPELKNSYRLQY